MTQAATCQMQLHLDHDLQHFSGALAQIAKKKRFSFICVCLSVRMYQGGSHSIWYWKLLWKYVDKFRV